MVYGISAAQYVTILNCCVFAKLVAIFYFAFALATPFGSDVTTFQSFSNVISHDCNWQWYFIAGKNHMLGITKS